MSNVVTTRPIFLVALVAACGSEDPGSGAADAARDSASPDASAIDASIIPDVSIADADDDRIFDAALPPDAPPPPPPDAGPAPAVWRHVSAGGNGTCAVREDMTARCWGTVPSPPEGHRFVVVGTNGTDGCGLDADEGWLRCWGESAWVAGAPDLGALRVRLRDVQCTFGGCCILVEGEGARCVGSSSVTAGVSRPGSTAMDVGDREVCVWTADGNVACSFPETPLPPVPARGGWAWIATFREYACGVVRDTGAVVCAPGDMAWLDDAEYVAIDGNFGSALCGIRRDGTLRCEREPRTVGPIPIADEAPPSGAFVQLSVGNDHACAIRSDGALRCWGSNVYGQIPLADDR